MEYSADWSERSTVDRHKNAATYSNKSATAQLESKSANTLLKMIRPTLAQPFSPELEKQQEVTTQRGSEYINV